MNPYKNVITGSCILNVLLISKLKPKKWRINIFNCSVVVTLSINVGISSVDFMQFISVIESIQLNIKLVFQEWLHNNILHKLKEFFDFSIILV